MLVNGKRLSSAMVGLFVAASMLASMSTAVFADETTGETTPEERTVYTSTDNFSIASGDGTWDDGVWSAQVLSNEKGTYTNLTYTCNNETEWCSESNGKWDEFVVSGSKIQAAKGGASEDWGVRTFTAPDTGKVNLTSDACIAERETAFYFRIVLENAAGVRKTLFPSDKAYETYYGWGTVAAINIENIDINKGDKIHYEIRRWGSSTAHAPLPLVSTVTYTDITPFDAYSQKEEYSSEENFKVEANVNGIWDGVWQGANYSTGLDKYDPLTLPVSVYTRLGSKNGMYSNVSANANSSAVAGSVMKTKNGTSTDLVVNSFLVPRDGLVSIAPGILRRHKDSVLGNPAGQSGDDDACGVKARIRVTRYATGETEQLWPLDQEDGFAHATVGKGAVLNTPELTVRVHWGDKIRFEFTEDPKSANMQYFIWKQSVRYAPKLVSASGEIITDFAAAVGAGVTAAIPAYSDLKDITDAVALVAFYDGEGGLYDVKIQPVSDFSQLIRIPLGEAKDLTAGSVKILLFDSMRTINPIYPFGGETLIFKADEAGGTK